MIMEKSLWVRFQEGDKSAFCSIYELYVNDLFSYGTKLCSDSHLVKDSIQDIFIDLFEHRDQLSEPRSVKYYLFKVLKRTIFRKLKKARKITKLSKLDILGFNTEYNFESKIIAKEIDANKNKLIA